MPHSGEVALQIPASVEGMVSSAYAKSENGSALSRNAATVRWAQVRGAARQPLPLDATRPRPAPRVPNSIRPRVDLERGERLGAHLDEQEAEAPDQGERGEPDPPVQRAGARARGGRVRRQAGRRRARVRGGGRRWWGGGRRVRSWRSRCALQPRRTSEISYAVSRSIAYMLNLERLRTLRCPRPPRLGERRRRRAARHDLGRLPADGQAGAGDRAAAAGQERPRGAAHRRRAAARRPRGAHPVPGRAGPGRPRGAARPRGRRAAAGRLPHRRPRAVPRRARRAARRAPRSCGRRLHGDGAATSRWPRVVRGDIDLAVVLDWYNKPLPVPGGLAKAPLLDDIRGRGDARRPPAGGPGGGGPRRSSPTTSGSPGRRASSATSG